jgi:hypothetical protein
VRLLLFPHLLNPLQRIKQMFLCAVMVQPDAFYYTDTLALICVLSIDRRPDCLTRARPPTVAVARVRDQCATLTCWYDEWGRAVCMKKLSIAASNEQPSRQ